MTSLTLPTLHIIKRGTLTEAEILKIRAENHNIEIVTEDEYESRIDRANREAVAAFLKELRPLSFNAKLDWYGKRNSQELIFLGNNPYFQRYWKLHVLLPMRIKRFFYRLKNGQLFKRYAHISEMKKGKGPERI